MAGVRHRDFDTNPQAYERSVREWQDLWDSMDGFARDLHAWTAPWLDTSMRDGNPIFSAWSPRLRRGLRIIQHDDAETFVVWRNTFAKGTQDAVDELTIDCALTDDHVHQAADLIAKWLRASAESQKPATLDVQVGSPHYSDRAA